MLYPQNGDRIVAIDYVTSLHPMYIRVHFRNITFIAFFGQLDRR